MDANPLMFDRISHIKRRRNALRTAIDAFAHFETWEETCVPSYVHPNKAAAGVAWWRLFAAVDAAKRHAHWGRTLDFGSSVGELGHLLPNEATPYEFIEQEEPAVRCLQRFLPDAIHRTFDDAPDGGYQVVFALDSLEHNKAYIELLGLLREKLSDDGILVLSGPTENALYRLGRRIAGFDSHYHEVDIYAIERAAEKIMTRVDTRMLPIGMPLFRISVWRK
jgi:hypothetical protein